MGTKLKPYALLHLWPSKTHGASVADPKKEIADNSDGSRQARPWRLRTRLALALLAVFIPIFALVIYSNFEVMKERRDGKLAGLQTVDETVAAVVNGFARDLQTFTLATSITLGEAADADIGITQETFGSYFRDLRDAYGVRAIFVTDLNGHAVAGSDGLIGFDVSGRDYYRSLRAGAETTWSDALAGVLSGQTTVVHGRVIKSSDGTPRAFLMVTFYPSQVADRLPDDLPDDANVTLIDKHGTVLFSSSDTEPQAPTRSIAGSDLFARAASGQSVRIKASTTPIDADKRYGAFVPVRDLGWTVGYTRPAAAVDGPLQSRFRRDIFVISVVFLAGFAAMFVISSRLSRPLVMLAAAADAIRRGDRPLVPIAAADADVRRLEAAMDTMSRAVVEREQKLEEQAVQLRRANQTQDRLLRITSRFQASRNALSPVLGPQEISRVVTVEAANAFEATAALIAVPLNDQSALTAVASFGYPSIAIEQMRNLPIDQPSPIVDAFGSGEARFFPRIDALIVKGEAGLLGGTKTLAAAVVPLKSYDQILGVIVLSFDQPRAFPDDEVAFIFGFAGMAAQAIHRAQLFETEKLAREELERSNQAKDEFLGIIAHELRTPVTTIFGSSRLLNDVRRNLPDDAKLELVQSLEHESERLFRLVENLLLVARAELGKSPEKEEFSPLQLITSVIDNIHALSPLREIRTTDLLRSETVFSERMTIEQVISNLVSNADKYSPANEPIEVRLEGGEADFTVRVLDKGPGVKPEELKLLFESFYRSPGTADLMPGKGLGLAVCKRLIESLSGRLWAQLRPGGGLEVGFTIPLGHGGTAGGEGVHSEAENGVSAR